MSSYYSTSSSSSVSTSSSSSSCCTRALAELKLYPSFVFAIPIIFTFILLFFFYLLYLRHRRLRLRLRPTTTTDRLSAPIPTTNHISTGLKKELREMLPIIVFKESFSVADTQCSVCLGDYQAEDKLQQIPACGHTFHMDCIDHWLATHTTCPLCRVSLLASTKTENQAETTNSNRPPNAGNSLRASLQNSEDRQ